MWMWWQHAAWVLAGGVRKVGRHGCRSDRASLWSAPATMTGWKLTAVGEGPSWEVAHLPDHSEELQRTADLTITVHGHELKLHSAVVAAGSRVLRTALCSCDGGASGSAAAAVQAAFEGCKLSDVQLFLK